MSLVTGQLSRLECDGHLSDTGWFLKTKFKFRERPIRVKRPMSDIKAKKFRCPFPTFSCSVMLNYTGEAGDS